MPRWRRSRIRAGRVVQRSAASPPMPSTSGSRMSMKTMSGRQFAHGLDGLPAVFGHGGVAAGHAEHGRQHVAVFEHVVDDQRADVMSGRQPAHLDRAAHPVRTARTPAAGQREVEDANRGPAWTRGRGCRPSTPPGGAQSRARVPSRPFGFHTSPVETARRRALGCRRRNARARCPPHRSASARSPARSARSVTPPRSVNLTALPSRLMSTCRSLRASPTTGIACRGVESLDAQSRDASRRTSGWNMTASSLEQRPQIELRAHHLHPPGVDLRQVEDLVDEMQQVARAAGDRLHGIALKARPARRSAGGSASSREWR